MIRCRRSPVGRHETKHVASNGASSRLPAPGDWKTEMVAGRYDSTPPLIPMLAAVGSRDGVLPLGRRGERGGWCKSLSSRA